MQCPLEGVTCVHIEDKSHLAPSAPLWPPAMAREPPEAGEAWRAWVLAKIGMTEAEMVTDENTFIEHALRSDRGSLR